MKKEDCKQVREMREYEFSYAEIAEKLSIPLVEAVIHGEGYSNDTDSLPSCNCDNRSISKIKSRPWREAEVLERLYIDYNISFTQIGEILGCNKETVQNQVDRLDIGIVPKKERSSSPTIRRMQRIAHTDGAEGPLGETNSCRSAKEMWTNQIKN